MLHNLRSDKSLLCDPTLALNRDSCKGKNSKAYSKETSAASGGSNDQTAQKLVALCDLVESQKNTLQRLTHCLSEADKNRCDLLKDLEEERQKNAELATIVSSTKPLEEAVREKNSKDSQVRNKITEIAALLFHVKLP